MLKYDEKIGILFIDMYIDANFLGHMVQRFDSTVVQVSGDRARLNHDSFCRSESRSRVEYLIPTNNIIVLDSYFNLTNKYNLIDRL